jgi:4-amino-4-deoxy-L-arabinose transferase-like glycosyltransferase
MLMGWLIVTTLYVSAWPWGRWLAASSGSAEDHNLLSILLAVALGSGGLTLVMFWLGLMGIRFELLSIVALYLLFMLPGWALWWRGSAAGQPRPTETRLNRWQQLALLGMVVISAGVLFNAAYWPFSKADTLGIYHRYGLLMFETGELVPFAGRDDAFYQAYPIHLPLAYTFSYLASGAVNEYLARVTPALLSLGCIPAAYLLGKDIFSAGAGWVSAFLLATTPTFVRWASSGYVDLPMAFYYSLATFFTLRLMHSQRRVDALLAGIMLGLAAWTKNAALVGLGLVALWALLALWRRWLHPVYLLIAGLSCAMVALPWYLRNWVEARLIVPPTAWVDQAEHSFRTALAFITHPQDFGLTGWLILIGAVLAVWQLILRKGQLKEAKARSFLLWLTLPFFGVWWWLVSYDLRFLLLFLPLCCVLGGAALWEAWTRLHDPLRRWLRPLVIAIAVILTVVAAWLSVEYKDEILRDPFMGDAARHAIVLGER